MRVAIIGAAGKMGSWFASYFAARGHRVAAFDVRPFEAKETVTHAKSVAECASDADLVVVCVPVKSTPVLVRQCAGHMKAGSTIAEISSVKSKTLPAMKKLPAGLSALCVHPMFGPGASPDRQQLRMLLVPVRDAKGEEELASMFFAGMSVKALPDARTHDRAIAAVLGLTYFVNVAYAGVLAKEKLETLKEVGGTTFGLQSMLAGSVMTDEPELVAALLRDNPYAAQYIKQYLRGAGELARLATAGGRSGAGRLEARVKKIQAALQKQQDLQASYRRMYEMLQSPPPSPSSSPPAAAAGRKN